MAADETREPPAPDPTPHRRILGLPVPVLIVAALLGVLVGIGSFTFHYAEGFSYFSHDPAACVNCHIMQPQYDSWQKSSHHTVAACVDCHLPPSGISKWIAKADNGYRHSKGFTFMDFPEPIRISDYNSRLLEDNCLRCHEELVHEIGPGSPENESLSCVHCHRDVGHGPMAGLGRADH